MDVRTSKGRKKLLKLLVFHFLENQWQLEIEKVLTFSESFVAQPCMMYFHQPKKFTTQI